VLMKTPHLEPCGWPMVSVSQLTNFSRGKVANAIASTPSGPRRLGMVSLIALALCPTFVHSARAIGGVDTTPAPAATHVTKFAAPKETRLENGLRVIVVERHDL